MASLYFCLSALGAGMWVESDGLVLDNVPNCDWIMPSQVSLDTL